MTLAANANRECSLTTIWRAYQASPFVLQHRNGPGANVGHDFLNARYYDGSRGQFLSQDPVSWGNPKAQNLTDPQSLNVYSYSGNNPITRSDPRGKCFGPAVED
jgi:RHS repeat-associated protein